MLSCAPGMEFSPSLASGRMVADRYRVEREAGAGGMGRVYRAVDAVSGQVVAIKVLATQARDGVTRFEREARVMAQLRHPGIVRYIEHGLLEEGAPFIVMEWVEGVSLSHHLGTALTVPASVGLARRICDALGEAHGRGFVHRDIKPGNILLQGGDPVRPKLMDFGLARAVELSQEITRTGALLGTPAYMAPEQARNATDLDPRADVFALGAVLYECLAGQRAFSGPNVVSVLCKVLLEELPWLDELRPEVPANLASLIARMLAKDPDLRPTDARAVREELDTEGLEDTGIQRRAIGSDEQRFHSVILAGWPGEGQPATLATLVGTPDREESLRRALAPFGARVDFMVDGSLVATLETGGSATDRAAIAARCALVIRDHMPGTPVVLATGRGTVAGDRPVGEAIDAASRLLGDAARRDMETTEGGTLLIEELTSSLLDPSFDLRVQGGRIELLGRRSGSEGRRRLLGRVSPCVGRSRELATLRATWEECLDEEVAQAVVVVGPAGMGKSRLRRELLREVGDDGMRAFTVGADPMGVGGAFGMAARLVREVAGIAEGDSDDVSQDKLTAAVVRHLSGDDALRVTEFLAEMLAVPFPGEQSVQLRAARLDPVLRGDQIRRAFLEWLAAECRAQPVLLVLEDLQWGDLPTIELIDAALRGLGGAPLMVVALARPELGTRFPRLWVDRGVTEIRLGPLRARAAARLVMAALPDISDAGAKALAERSGGHPFFLEELIRAEAAGRGDSAPQTVLAMIQTRLEALEPEARRLLRAASVFGDSFWVTGVARLLGTEQVALNDLIDVLVERELLVRAANDDGEGDQELSFAHGLWREASYATFTPEDQELGHRLAAGWLENRRRTDPLTLAVHWERGGHGSSATRWYRRAAEQALAGDDLEGALERVTKGVRCGAGGEELGELRRIQAEAHKWKGDNLAAEEAAYDALGRLPEGGASWYVAVGEAAAASGKLGHGEELEGLVAVLRGPEPESGAMAARTVALARTTTQLVLAGRVDSADALLAELEAAGADDPAVAGWVREARAVRAGSLGDPGARVLLAQASAACFEGAGDLRNACLQLISVGFARNEIGDYAGAEAALEQALDFGDRMGLVNALSTARAQLGRAQARLGRGDEAETTLRRAIAELTAQSNRRLAGVARSYLAWLLCELSRLEEASVEARSAIAELEAAPPLRASAEATLALVLLARGHTDEALESALRGQASLESVGRLPTGEGLVRYALVAALEAEGQTDAASTARGEARAQLEERAAKIADGGLRSSFREHVREHALTLS